MSRDRAPRATISALTPARPSGRVTDARTIVFFPEGAFGPTNNCVGIGQVLRARGHRVVFIVEESFAGTLEAKGFEERLMRLGPTPEVARDPRPVLDRLHPRHGAGVPQADHRAARRVHRAHLAGPDRRREVRPPAAARDHRRARRRTSSSRTTSSASRRLRRRAGRGSGSRRAIRPRSRIPPSPPFSSGYPAADRSDWPAFLDEVERTHRDMWDGLRRVLPRARRCGAQLRPARPRLHPGVAVAQPLPLPGRGRLRARATARPDLAPAGLDGPRGRDDLGAARTPRGPGRRADLPVAGQPRLGGRRR